MDLQKMFLKLKNLKSPTPAGVTANTPPLQPTTFWRRSYLLALLAGLLGALAFPLVIDLQTPPPNLTAPTLSDSINHRPPATPILDHLPRELGILLAAALLYYLLEQAPPCLSREKKTAEKSFPTRATSKSQLFMQSKLFFIAGCSHFALLLYWLDIAMARYGDVPQWLALPILGLLVSYCALFWAAIPLVYYLLKQALVLLQLKFPRQQNLCKICSLFTFPISIVFLEYLRGEVLFNGFPWGLWAYSQTRNLPFCQLAKYVGVFGLSFLIALTAVGSVHYLKHRHTPKAVPAGLSLFALLLVLILPGTYLLQQPPTASSLKTQTPTPKLQIAILQGNIEQKFINQLPNHQPEVLQKYWQLAKNAADRRPSLIVWPEGAWPYALRADQQALNPPLALGVPQLIGATILKQPSPWLPLSQSSLEVYNSAVYVDATGQIDGHYHKQHLVPFGEYVPLRWLLPVNKLIPDIHDIAAGTSAKPLGEAQMGVLICYDGVFPALARKAVQAGSKFLVNLTNDAWYGYSSGPYQHRDFYILRAIETGRWLIRATNTGISVFIDPQGKMHQATTLGTSTISTYEITPTSELTFYVQYGDIVLWLSNLAVLVASLSYGYQWLSTYRQSKQSS